MDTHNRYLALASVALAVLIILLFSVHVSPARELDRQHHARASMHTVFSCRTKPTMFWCHQ